MKKPRNQIAKEILIKLLIGGAIIYAAQSPYIWMNFYKEIFKKRKKFNQRQFYNAFYNLKKRGFIDIQKNGKQIYISLTKEGEKKAGKFQINKLKIIPQERWDQKWRVIIFDIPEKGRIKREAFRGKIKELGFYPLQKSVWVYPYPCQKEIELLREFFGLTEKDLRILTTEEIEKDDSLKNFFKL